jgi:crotonobetainyl-CoA:carnitine CoA-transferase CaiB-like acyl-CoA transferase
MALDEISPRREATKGGPLTGVRILALEQMQALPFATQLLGRLGAEVTKVEAPVGGDLGRGSLPSMLDPAGRPVGATFLRNNLNKRSICIDLKRDEGRQLVRGLVPRFDVVAENFKSGTISRLGLDYEDLRPLHPGLIYVSVSGFGQDPRSPYRTWPAFACVAEAMSGIYEMKRSPHEAPDVAPVGALGDISAALFATIGILAALRHRDITGEGQQVDIAMLDSVIAMTDIVANLWSMGLQDGNTGPLIMHGFRASDGWFVLQVGRESQFAKLVDEIGHPEWVDDPRFATREGWVEHLPGVLRPAIEAWASKLTKLEAARRLAAAGIAAGPCYSESELVTDPHVVARRMLVEVPRTDGIEQPVLVPGNPVKLSRVPDGPDERVPWLGEHTDEVLGDELQLSQAELSSLRAAGVIS